jgi:hypothetical protein
MEFSGASLVWSGFWVCPTCSDLPNAQLLSPNPLGDPKPVVEPRPENFQNARRQFGFTFEFLSLAPGDPAAVLAQLGALASPIPNGGTAPSDATVTLAQAMTAQSILAANGARTWLAVYNPSAAPVVVSTGTAAFSGDPAAIILGQGQAIYAATPTPYAGALSAIGYFAGNPLLVFEAPAVATSPPLPVVMP